MRARGILATICIGMLIMSISGCAGKQGQVKSPFVRHSGNYSATARIQRGQLQAVARISRETPFSCSVVFESPPSLENMAFMFRQDNVDLSYKGLNFSFAPDSVPGGAVARIAVDAVNKAMNGDTAINERSDGTIELTGLMESGEFSLMIDKETGNMIKLSVPSEELEIDFENFRFLD